MSTQQCHFCMQTIERSKQSMFFARCSIKRCCKSFCLTCIRVHFDAEYKVELYNSQCWICYFCQHTCRCSKCHQPEKLALEKKSSSRKKNSVSLIAARREDITDNGQNNSDSFRGSEKSIEKNNLIYNPLFENDSKSVSKGPSQVVNYSIMEEDEIKQLPPFMRKIVERKNLFYRFVMRQQKQEHDKQLATTDMVSEHQMEPHSSLSKGQVPQTNTAKYKKIIQKALEECDIDSDDGFQIVN